MVHHQLEHAYLHIWLGFHAHRLDRCWCRASVSECKAMLLCPDLASFQLLAAFRSLPFWAFCLARALKYCDWPVHYGGQCVLCLMKLSARWQQPYHFCEWQNNSTLGCKSGCQVIQLYRFNIHPQTALHQIDAEGSGSISSSALLKLCWQGKGGKTWWSS